MEQYAYFEGNFVPLAEAKVSVMTHSFNYGTACFEGIRAYWNEEKQRLAVFRLREHYERLHRSCHILRIKPLLSIDEMCEVTLELLRKNQVRTDSYIRPICYKSSLIIGVNLHGIDDGFTIFSLPFGKYIEAEAGIHCQTSSWRRIDDNSIPARAKVVGGYINSALAKSEAQENGFDEAIMLNQDGHVSEGSGENVFIYNNGSLITPDASQNVLIGVTRDAVITLAREEFGIPTVERAIDRSELYTCQECFLTGTAAEITPVAMVDRRAVGDGQIGEVTSKLHRLFMDVARGNVEKYAKWLTPVN